MILPIGAAARCWLAACSAVLLAVAAPPLLPAVADTGQVAARYAEAVSLAHAGETERALEALGELARDVPASVPVHRALALTALASGEAAVDTWNATFRERLRRTRRDVGASVGRAVLLAAEGRDREAHALLTSAIFTGARHPLLVPLLLETSPDPQGLADWSRRRARALGDDPDFEALRARLLIELGRTRQAAEVVSRTLDDHPRSVDLLALQARLTWAAGREEEACEQAALAIGFLEGRAAVADVRVPRRAALARALIACGRHGDAQTVLGGLGPRKTPPGAPSVEPIARAATAELTLARGRLVEAAVLALPDDAASTAAPEPWDETLRSVRIRARARAGLPAESGELRQPLHRNHAFALVDRSLALAARAASPGERGGPPPLGPEPYRRVSRALLDQGLSERGVRAALLGEMLAGSADEGGREIDDLLAILAPEGEGAPVTLRTVARMVRVRRAMAAGDRDAVLRLTRIPAVERAGAPGALLAALRVARARAALAAGEPDEALAAVEEGLLDLQSADLERAPLPGELAPFSNAFDPPATALPGLAFRAALERGDGPAEAVRRLLEAIDRSARTWSILGLPDARDVEALTRRLPADGCLIVAPPLSGRSEGEDGAPAARLAPGAEVSVGTPERLLSTPPCDDAEVVRWLGPGRAPGGLAASNPAGGVLVRWIGPRPNRDPSRDGQAGQPTAAGAGTLGPGPPRDLRKVVEGMILDSSAQDTEPTDLEKVARIRLYGWPIFTGAGLAPSTEPLASGWLVPPGGPDDRGWMTPQNLPPPPATPAGAAPGLVALGLRATPDGAGSERGLWLLGEAGVDAGWAWALLSRRPLESEEVARLRGDWDRWRENPIRAARRLADADPELARALTLWTAPGRLRAPEPVWPWIAGLAVAVAAGSGLALARPWRRLRRPGRAGRDRRARRAPRDRPS